MRSHLPLVRAMARRYARRREEFDDLVQAGSVGLVKASTRFDPSRGVNFATFVAPTVEGEMRRHLRERGGGVRMPREMQRMSTELRRCRSELAASLGRAPDVRELAAALDADVGEVERLIAADLARDPVALTADAPAAELPADAEPLAASEYRVLLAGGLRALNARERRIVFLRFHADMTERQIARTIGISQAHVSRLLEGALTKLRAELTSPEEPQADGDSSENGLISPDVGETKPLSPPSSDARPGKAYSGRVLVRMPSELHEQLVLAAEREDVSLNRYVNHALETSVDSAATGETSGDEDAPAPSSPALTGSKLRIALATNLAVVVLAGVVAVALLVLALQQGV